MIRVISNQLIRFDLFLLQRIFGWNGLKIVDRIFYWITHSGDGYLYGIIGISLLLGDPTDQWLVLAGLVAFALELPLHAIIKKITKRDRPFERINGISARVVPPKNHSFPSGHTAAAFIMAYLLSVKFPYLKPFFFGWASLVGFSRVYLGVHYPTDVFGGIALGLLSVKFGIWLFS